MTDFEALNEWVEEVEAELADTPAPAQGRMYAIQGSVEVVPDLGPALLRARGSISGVTGVAQAGGNAYMEFGPHIGLVEFIAYPTPDYPSATTDAIIHRWNAFRRDWVEVARADNNSYASHRYAQYRYLFWKNYLCQIHYDHSCAAYWQYIWFG